MLELLTKYAHTHDITVEPGFKSKDARWSIVLDSNTGFLGMVELGEPGQKRNPGRTFPKCPDLSQAELIGGSTPRSHFLVETAGVVALYDVAAKDSKTKEKQRQKHQDFIGKLAEAGKTTPQLGRVAEFLNNDEVIHIIQSAMLESKVKASEKVTFQIDGEFPLERDDWHAWWRSYRESLKGEPAKTDNETSMRCLVTGDFVTPMKTHLKIERLAGVGGQPSGDVLIGFDKEAYRSYGLEQSANAAVSEEAVSAYRSGLNELIKNHSQRLTGTMVVHWFKEIIAVTDDPLVWLVESPEQQELNAQYAAKILLQSIRMGERPDLSQNYYYALTLSGAGGRVMVRDWMEGPFDELVRNINQWFDDLEIVNLDGAKSAGAPGLERVVTCLLPSKKPKQEYGNWIKPVGGERTGLLHSAIKGIPIGYQIVSRVVSEHRNFILAGELDKLLEDKTKDLSAGLMYSLVYARMGLIKAYHLRKYRKEGNNIMADNLKPVLNEDFHSPAYQCGRLMAMLAELQRAALGDVGAGVVQRYYAAASTTPALVLGRLTRTSQFHLNKLEPGLAHWYESKIAGIWSQLNEEPPRTLSLEDQSLFAMGYYQQLASMRVKKFENTKEEKEATNG